MNQLIFLDTETTGNDMMKDRLCQVCYQTSAGTFTEYFRPPIPVSVKAMSVTHITNKMLADKPLFRESAMRKDLQILLDEGIMVAHNAKFDAAMLESEGMNVPRRICTFRLARHLDPENVIPEYGLQFLRYYLDLDVEGANVHDAEADVNVLRRLFERLFAKMVKEGRTEEQAIAEMLEVSARPILFKLFNFGKYKDKKIEEVAKTDRRYLEWLYDQKAEQGEREEDWIHTLEYYLGK
jgi:DNA polymerase III epsilon subunit-like protein